MNAETFLTIEGFVDSSVGSSGSVAPAITAPDTLLATADADSIVLTWNNSQVYDAIHIERKDSGAYFEIAVITGTLTTYDDTSALINTAYTYRIRGRVQVARYSAYSNESTATISVGTPHSISSDASNGNYLTAINPTSLAFVNTDTVIFGGWINMTSRINDCFIGKLETGLNIYYFTTDGAGHLDFAYFTGGGLAEIIAAAALSNSTKYFVIAWVDPATTTVNIQVNGGIPESFDYSGIASPFSMGSGDFFLGNDGLDSTILNGLLDEVFVCKNPASLSDALTAINTTIYNSGNGALYSTLSGATKTTIGLQNWWGLDEASGTRLDLHGSIDLTANGTVAAGAALVS